MFIHVILPPPPPDVLQRSKTVPPYLSPSLWSVLSAYLIWDYSHSLRGLSVHLSDRTEYTSPHFKIFQWISITCRTSLEVLHTLSSPHFSSPSSQHFSPCNATPWASTVLSYPLFPKLICLESLLIGHLITPSHP